MNLLLRPANGPLVRWVAAGKGGPSRRRGGRGGRGRARRGAPPPPAPRLEARAGARGLHPSPRRRTTRWCTFQGPRPSPKPPRGYSRGAGPPSHPRWGGGGAHRRRAARAPRRSPCDPRRRETRAEARGAAPRCPHRGPARARPSRDPGGGCATRRVVPFDEASSTPTTGFRRDSRQMFPGTIVTSGAAPRGHSHSSCARRGSRRVHESTVVRRTTRREASRVQLLAASLCS